MPVLYSLTVDEGAAGRIEVSHVVRCLVCDYLGVIARHVRVIYKEVVIFEPPYAKYAAV
jgi:hypothetical protein